jgi:hypothetical protein
MATKEPAAEPKAAPKASPEDELAAAETLARAVRNNPGVDRAEVERAVKELAKRQLGDDWVTSGGTWTLDPSNTPVLHRAAEPPEG